MAVAEVTPHGARTPVGERPFVVLGVSAGIAAYKAVEVCRRLVERRRARGPGPDRTGHPVRRPGHVRRPGLRAHPDRACGTRRRPSRTPGSGQRADLIVVAPATADLLARYAAGLADDLLTTTLVATARSCRGVPGHAHRDVGAPVGARQSGDASRPVA